MSIYRMRTEFGHHLKWLMGILAFIFIIGAIWSFSSMPSMDQNGAGGRGGNTIATVNGMPISKNEMETAFAQAAKELSDQGVRSTLQLAFRRANVFQSLVDSRLKLVAAKQMGVNIDAKDVEAKRQELITQFLKNRRTMVLGKLSKSEEALDPRKDSDFISELKRNGMSIGQIEEEANQYIPEAQVEVMVAQDGLRKAIEKEAGTVTDADVMDSYNVYRMRQIIIPKNSLPKDQLTTQVDKIVADAQKGGDFAKLAEQYSKDQNKGRLVDYTYQQLSPEVWKQVTKMKAGEVSSPIDTDQAVYIVKLESVTPKLPAKLDNKAKSDRKKEIEFMRQYVAAMKVDKITKDSAKVKCDDPEMAGYWHLYLSQQGSPAESKKQMSLAAAKFKEAMVKESNNDYATTMLALIMKQEGKNEEATKLLYQLLEGKDSRAEGSDLRIMLGDMLVQAKKDKEAIDQYQKASDAAVADLNTHQQLVMKFQQLKRPDLVAKEQATVADLTAKMKAREAQQKATGSAPTAPRPGG